MGKTMKINHILLLSIFLSQTTPVLCMESEEGECDRIAHRVVQLQLADEIS